jgi:DNA-binding CsgD family transcriptional regulator
MSIWNFSSGPPEAPKPSALLASGIWPNLAAQLRLSPREVQVVKGVFRDDKEQAIAADLGISPHTVSTYLQRIYAKLRVGSRPQLIVRVVAEYLRVGKPV